MLRHIYIKDFAIINQLDLELTESMTVITGETGAGKSIVIDALDMALGERADNRWIRHGSDRCDIALSFDVSHISGAQQWLHDHDLIDAQECVIRRSITKEGRSRHSINGQPVTLTELKELSQQLVHIHGQHQHQHLVKREQQRKLLDDFAEHPHLLEATKQCFLKVHQIETQIKKLTEHTQSNAEKELLRYQLEELETLSLKPGEFSELSTQQEQLTHAESLLHALAETDILLTAHEDGFHVKGMLEKAIQQLTFGEKLSPAIANAIVLLDSAIVEVTEASSELKQAQHTIHVDPEQLAQVETRLGLAFQLARKHKTTPDALPELAQFIDEQLNQSETYTEQLAALTAALPEAEAAFIKATQTLYQSRAKAAKRLSALVTQSLHTLHMQDAEFAIELTQDAEAPSAFGTCRVEFWVSSNKGQPKQPLAKIASGGEISRISLAIQVITAKHAETPTLVFDEVDVGIGGATAAVVGQLLRQLGEHAQVLCITHLPQVAACGHQHIRISKFTEDDMTHSTLIHLKQAERVEELARMLGGTELTKEGYAHAEAMLSAQTNA